MFWGGNKNESLLAVRDKQKEAYLTTPRISRLHYATWTLALGELEEGSRLIMGMAGGKVRKSVHFRTPLMRLGVDSGMELGPISCWSQSLVLVQFLDQSRLL